MADDQIQSSSESSARSRNASSAGSLVSRVLRLLSSAPFGIVLLMLLIIACTIDDLYRTKYFYLLLAVAGFNLILAGVRNVPAALSDLVRKKLTASPSFAMAQNFKEKIELPILGREQLVVRAAAAARAMGFKIRVTVEETQTTIFAERDAWNRLGAYAVQVGLLTIFAAGFWNNSRGYTGKMWIEPGKRTDKIAPQVPDIENATTPYAAGQREWRLPFTVEGLDLQQTLLDQNRSRDMGNTLDWITRVRIDDHETGQATEAVIHMNSPLDYRGHRFLQISSDPRGDARTIKLKVTPVSGGASEEVAIERNGKVKLSDGAQLHYLAFNPSFTVKANQEVETTSREYLNPAARLAYLKPDGEQGEMWAFTESFLKQISNASFLQSKVFPYRLVLTDFEKAPHAHLLQIQYSPGTTLLYGGVLILGLALIGVFFFSHQRLWIVVEDGTLSLGGNANRNQHGFESRAKKIVAMIREPWTVEDPTSS